MQITIDCNRAAEEKLMPFLEQIRIMGSIGSSRTIKIEDWSDRKEDWAQDKFYFDGDGPDTITKIESKEKIEKTKRRNKL